MYCRSSTALSEALTLGSPARAPVPRAGYSAEVLPIASFHAIENRAVSDTRQDDDSSMHWFSVHLIQVLHPAASTTGRAHPNQVDLVREEQPQLNKLRRSGSEAPPEPLISLDWHPFFDAETPKKLRGRCSTTVLSVT